MLLVLVQGTVGAPVFEDHVLLTSRKGGYHTYRIPAAICTAEGTVLFFCEARKNSSSDFGQTHLLLLSSSDRGRTWSDPRVVWKDDSEPNVTIGNPYPVLDVRTGAVWIGFTRNNQRAFVTKSTDDGRTWATLCPFRGEAGVDQQVPALGGRPRPVLDQLVPGRDQPGPGLVNRQGFHCWRSS